MIDSVRMSLNTDGMVTGQGDGGRTVAQAIASDDQDSGRP